MNATGKKLRIFVYDLSWNFTILCDFGQSILCNFFFKTSPRFIVSNVKELFLYKKNCYDNWIALYFSSMKLLDHLQLLDQTLPQSY